MKHVTLRLVLIMVIVFCAVASAQQLPTIRITTQGNQDPTTGTASRCPDGRPPNGWQCPGGGFPTQVTVMNYVSITNFELTDPNNSQNNLTLVPQPQSERDSIRVRGNSTATQNKRPYRIKFDKRQSLFGKERARSWVLIANFYDYTMALNAMALELGRRLGLEFTNSFVFVDVHVNNSYKGIYMLTEQIQVNPGRVNIDPDFGWLVEFDYHAPEPHHITFTTAGGNISMPARIRDPEVNDNNFTIDNQIVRFVPNEVNALFNAMAASGFPENGYRDLIDLESWAKYVLIQQLMDNFDFNSKVQGQGMGTNQSQYGLPGSNYAYKDFNKRIHAGPLWDFDLAAGLIDPGMNMTNWPRHYVTYQEALRPRHPFYQRLWEDPVFLAKFKKIWDRHQADFNAMPNFIDAIANSLAGRVQANFAAYTGGPNETAARPNSEQTYRVHVNNLKTWWNQRMQFFGQQLNNMNIDTSKDINQNPGASVARGDNAKRAGMRVSAVKNGIVLKAENRASIKVYCINGREVRKMAFAGGNHTVQFKDLPRGMYVVNAVVDGQKSAVRMPVR